MLKKVMIICLALSFVFVGGIGIALAGDPIGDGPFGPFGPNDGKEKNGPNGPNDTCPDFISNDSSIIIAAQNRNKRKPEDGAPNSGDGISDGSGWLTDPIDNDYSMKIAASRVRDRDRDQLKDGCSLPFTSNNSSIIIADYRDRDRDRDRDSDQLKDGSCNG